MPTVPTELAEDGCYLIQSFPEAGIFQLIQVQVNLLFCEYFCLYLGTHEAFMKESKLGGGTWGAP